MQKCKGKPVDITIAQGRLPTGEPSMVAFRTLCAYSSSEGHVGRLIAMSHALPF